MDPNASEDDNVAVLNQSLDSAAQEAHQLLLVFKRHIAYEFEKEMLKVPLNSPDLVSQRHLVLNAMMAQWNIIRALCFLLAENTGPDSLLVDLENQMGVIEGIFDTLRMKKAPFKEHEYVFPFNVLKLLTMIKNGVKSYLSSQSVNQSTIAAIDKVIIPSNRAVVGVVGSTKRTEAPTVHIPSPSQPQSSATASTPGTKVSPSVGVPTNVKDAKKLFESIENQISIDAMKMKQRPPPPVRSQPQSKPEQQPSEVRQKVLEKNVLEGLNDRNASSEQYITALSSLNRKQTTASKLTKSNSTEQITDRVSPLNPDSASTQEYETVVSSMRSLKKGIEGSIEDIHNSNRSLSQSRTSSRSRIAVQTQDVHPSQSTDTVKRLATSVDSFERTASLEKEIIPTAASITSEPEPKSVLTHGDIPRNESGIQQAPEAVETENTTEILPAAAAIASEPEQQSYPSNDELKTDNSSAPEQQSYPSNDELKTDNSSAPEQQSYPSNDELETNNSIIPVPESVQSDVVRKEAKAPEEVFLKSSTIEPVEEKHEVNVTDFPAHPTPVSEPHNTVNVNVKSPTPAVTVEIKHSHVHMSSEEEEKNEKTEKSPKSELPSSTSPSPARDLPTGGRKGSVFSNCSDLTEIEKVLSNKFAALKNQISESRNLSVIAEHMHISVPPPPVAAAIEAPIFRPQRPPELPVDQTVARTSMFSQQAANDSANGEPVLASLNDAPSAKVSARPISRIISLRPESGSGNDMRLNNRSSRMLTNRLSTLADLKTINSQIAARQESIRQSMQFNKEGGLLETIMSTYSKLDSEVLKQAAEVSAPVPIEPVTEESEQDHSEKVGASEERVPVLEQKIHLPSENTGRVQISALGGMKSLPELDTEEFSTSRFVDTGNKAPSVLTSQTSLNRYESSEMMSSPVARSPSVARRPLRVNLGLGRSMTTRVAAKSPAAAKSIDAFMNIDSSDINVDVASWLMSNESLDVHGSASDLTRTATATRRGDVLLVPSLVRAKTITQKQGSRGNSAVRETPPELPDPVEKVASQSRLPHVAEHTSGIEAVEIKKIEHVLPRQESHVAVNSKPQETTSPLGKPPAPPAHTKPDSIAKGSEDIVRDMDIKSLPSLPQPMPSTEGPTGPTPLLYDHKIHPSLLSIPMSLESIRVILIPLNGMFDLCTLDLSTSNRFGRNNTSNHPAFKAFSTLVVSRNHMDLFEKDGKIYIKDIGSNSGTFRNNARVSQPGVQSPDVEIHTGDYIQMGKDYTADGGEYDSHGRIQAKRRCVRFQVIIIPPSYEVEDVIKTQPVPIEEPLNKSDPYRPDVEPTTRTAPVPISPMAPQPTVNRATKPVGHSKDTTKSSFAQDSLTHPTGHAREQTTATISENANAAPTVDHTHQSSSISIKEKLEEITKLKPGDPAATMKKSDFDVSRSRSVFVKRSDDKNMMGSMKDISDEAQKKFISMREAMKKSGTDLPGHAKESSEASVRSNVRVPIQVNTALQNVREASEKDPSNILSPGSISRLGLFEKRENFVLAIVTSGNKLKRLQISNGQGGQTIDVQLKRWEERRLQIVDLRANGLGVIEIFDPHFAKTNTKKGPPPLASVTFSVNDAAGTLLGNLKFQNALKLDVIPPNQDSNSPLITITGNFKEDRFILIRKAPNSREQRLFGECKGRHLVKKGFQDVNWLANLEIEQTELNPLIFSAAVLCCVASSSL